MTSRTMGNPLAASTAALRWWGEILLAAALLTLLNGLKPLTVDDGAYYYRAAQIASHPADPCGGPPFWDRDATPGTQMFVPPVFSAWWALAMRLGGDNQWFWRLWQLPIALLLVGALAALLRRFAAGVERPLLWLTVFSPAFLPSFNLMVDLPALALTLSAVYCFLRAVDRESLLAALLAGALAGLAMQTKYTGVSAVAAICLYGLLTRRWRLTLAAALVAAGIFVSWEALEYWRYGISQFLFSMVSRQEAASGRSVVSLVTALATVVGCAAPGLVPLAFLARGAKPRSVYCSIGAIVTAYAILTFVPPRIAGRSLPTHYFTVDLIGWPLWWLCLTLIGRECLARWPKAGREERFLTLWLMAEIVLYFPLSPFPAVRRVLGVVVVLTLLLGREVARRLASAPRQRMPLYAAAVLNVAAGLLLWGVDLRDSRAQYDAVQHSLAFLRTQTASGTRWFTGDWGFQYYAWRAGMKPLVPGQSHLRPGDWVVFPLRLAGSPPGVVLDEQKLTPAAEFTTGDALPLSTQNGYYAGKHPLQHRRAPQVQAVIYRVTADYPLPATARVGSSRSLWGGGGK